MSGVKPFYLLKENQELPDAYGLKVHYVTGKEEEFELAQHSFNKETQLLEFWTSNDIVNWIPLSAVNRVEFDKRFSKMVAIKQEMERKKVNG